MAESDQVSEIEQIKLDSVDLTWEQMVQEYHRSGRYAVAASAMNLKCVKNLWKCSMVTLEFLSRKGFNKEMPEEAGTITPLLQLCVPSGPSQQQKPASQYQVATSWWRDISY